MAPFHQGQSGCKAHFTATPTESQRIFLSPGIQIRTGRSWRSPRPMGALGRKNVGCWMFQFFSWLSPFFWMLDSWIQIRYWINIPQNKCFPVFGRRIGIIPSGQCGSFGDLSLWSHYEYPHFFFHWYESKPLVNPGEPCCPQSSQQMDVHPFAKRMDKVW